jgi:hypothetical protein
MFMWDSKKKLQTMLQKRNKAGDIVSGPMPMKPEVSLDEGGEIDQRHVAAQDVMAAFHEKSAEKLKGALSNFMDLHMAMGGGDDDEPDPDME